MAGKELAKYVPMKDRTPKQRAAARKYRKTYQAGLRTKMREAGITGTPRPKMSEAERTAKMSARSKTYRGSVKGKAAAKKYRQKNAALLKRARVLAAEGKL